MYVDWDHDPRPAWDIVLGCRTAVTWDELDRARLAKELNAIKKVRHAAVAADTGNTACRIRMRMKADSGAEAVECAVVIVESASRDLGVVLGNIVHVGIRSAARI